MSYEPLHHKYRPQTFAQLVGQEAIASTLTNAINSEKIAPAYLFTGPRGTGKTSSARIFAKSLNCLSTDKPTPQPCGNCEACRSITRGSALDVIEIDAASNTGVDNIREIIEKSQFSPVQCRYKVYVIDECHMLSTAAFNALLKTLEEPPNRVIFVLATTDPQRVLPTIISRCQRFDYRRIPLESMAAHLRHIATEENIDITPEAVSLVAQIANGGLRDAESLLDQLSLLPTTITADKVWDLVGAVPEQDLLELIKAIATDQVDLVLTQCRKLMDRGREPLVVLQNLANFYLNLLIAKNAPNRADLIAVTENTWQSLRQESQKWDTNLILQGQKTLKDSEVQLKNTTQPRLWLEVTLLSLLPSALSTPIVINSASSANIPQASTNISVNHSVQNTQLSTIESPINSQTDYNNQISASKTPSFTSSEKTESSFPETSEIPDIENSSVSEIWQFVLKYVQPRTTQVLLNQHCHLMSFDGKVAIIGIKNKSLFKVANSKMSDIEKAFRKFYNPDIRINLQIDNSDNIETKPINNFPNQETKPVKEKEENKPNLHLIKNDPEDVKPPDILPNQKNNLEIVDNFSKIEPDQEQIEKPDKVSSVSAKKAAENLAQFFNGEIVTTEANNDDEIPF